MENFKGTKGDWKEINIQLTDWSNCSVGVDKGQVICTMYYEGVEIPEEAKANAKLVSVAPDLLEALYELISLKKWKDEFGKDEWYLEKQPLAWINAEKVLEKALT